MLVNHVQIAYILGVTPLKAKLMMKPYIERFSQKSKFQIKPIDATDFVESSLLGAVFHHPSADLDGKDRIAFTITTLHNGVNNGLKKKIVEDISCLKAGKIAGKYKALLSILNKNDIDEINGIIRRRRVEFIQSGGRFPTRKFKNGLQSIN